MRTLVALAALLAGTAAAAVELEGHRGARGLAPENTLAAFAAGIAAGADTLELDVGVTKDGVVVVAHDRRLNPDLTRDAEGRWLGAPGPPIASLTLAELRRFDVGRAKPGSRTAAAFPEQQPRDGERIPTLAQVFAAAGPRVRFDIETKLSPLAPDEAPAPEAFAGALLDAIRAHGVESRVTVQSFDWRTLRIVQREAPAIPTACLTSRSRDFDNVADPRWTAGLSLADHGGSVPKLARAAGCAVWSPRFADLDAAALAEAHALGLKVVVWTVNAPAEIERALALGVDGIISDRPDRVRAALDARRR